MNETLQRFYINECKSLALFPLLKEICIVCEQETSLNDFYKKLYLFCSWLFLTYLPTFIKIHRFRTTWWQNKNFEEQNTPSWT